MRRVLAKVGAVRRPARPRKCLNPPCQTIAACRRAAGLSLALAIPLAIAAAPAGADEGWHSGQPPAERLDYAVTREGSPVGLQTVEFLHEGEGLVVRTHIEIDVRFLSISLYRFRHDAEERWADGRLAAFSSSTDDDGKQREVALVAKDGRLMGRYNDNPVDLPGDLVPASLWHPATLTATVLLDPIRGRTRDVSVADQGMEEVTAAGGEIEARHYAMTGQITRDLWYDDEGKLVLVRFPAKDGSEITVTLQP
jgi:hypothetical protein